MKKGFTLIELLAVIVILAIIALIAAPIVLNIINESKTNIALRSIDNYLHALELKIANKELIKEKYEDGVYSIDEFEIEIKGEKPTSGFVQIADGQIEKYSLMINNVQTSSKEEYDLWDGISISEMTPDANGDYHITKASELAWLARETNAGTTFEGVNFYLKSNLDLNNKDWTPIGTSTNKFKGNFYGNNHVIKNMNINNTDSKNQGLFGDITSIVDGLIIKDSVAISKIRVGILAGISRVSASVSNITIYNSKAQALDNVAGGIIGQFQGIATNLKVINSNIESTIGTGGIIGTNPNSSTVVNQLNNCYTDSNTHIYTSYKSGENVIMGAAGGIAGIGIMLSIDNSVSYATVEGLGQNIGGIVGQLASNSTIKNTKMFGNVKGEKFTGGLAGIIVNSSISYCSVFGDIIAEESSSLGSLAGSSESSELTNNIISTNLNNIKGTLDNLIGSDSPDTFLQNNIIK